MGGKKLDELVWERYAGLLQRSATPTFYGYKLIIVPSEPKIQVRRLTWRDKPDLGIFSDKCRDEMNAWLIERFGWKRVCLVDEQTGTMYMDERTSYEVKKAIAASIAKQAAAKLTEVLGADYGKARESRGEEVSQEVRRKWFDRYQDGDNGILRR